MPYVSRETYHSIFSSTWADWLQCSPKSTPIHLSISVSKHQRTGTSGIRVCGSRGVSISSWACFPDEKERANKIEAAKVSLKRDFYFASCLSWLELLLRCWQASRAVVDNRVKKNMWRNTLNPTQQWVKRKKLFNVSRTEVFWLFSIFCFFLCGRISPVHVSKYNTGH